MSEPTQQHGLLVLDKPKGPTSAGCLEKIKRGLKQKKIGHAGTLDPMATGVLLVLLGQATKIAGYLTEGDKIYSGVLELGVSTDTYDLEGQVTQRQAWEHLGPDTVRETVLQWREMTTQTIPPYSAAKHKGKPLYKLSREGKETPEIIKPLRVTLAEVLSLELPRVHFRVRCAAGTYIRSLVHSLGMRLGCGAVLTALTREYSHPFGLEQAHPLEAVLREPEALPGRVLPLADALPHWPRVGVDEQQTRMVKNGVRLDFSPETARVLPFAQGARAVLVAPGGGPLALAEAKLADGKPVWAVLRGLWQS